MKTKEFWQRLACPDFLYKRERKVIHATMKSAAALCRHGKTAAFALALAGVGVGVAQAADTVRIGTASTSVVHAPLTMAIVEPTIFGKHNIELEISYLRGNSTNCVTAIISKAVDVCQVGTTTGTNAIAEGAKLKAIAILAGPVNEIVLSAKSVKESGVSPDAPVADRIRAMKGMRITSAVSGSAHHTALIAMLSSVGMKIDDIEYQVLHDVAAMMESIRNGRIDGSLWTVGTLGGVIEDGTGVRWISMARGDVKELSSLPYVTAYARTEWIEANPGLAKRVHDAYADSIAYMKANPEKASKMIKAEFYPDLDQKLWDNGFEEALNAFFDNAMSARGGWQKFLELQAINTGKDYKDATFEAAVMDYARKK
jgi:NitT/TauT family transport system substrate-binding protein